VCTNYVPEIYKVIGLRGIPTRRGNPSRFVVSKPTGAVRYITLYERVR